MSKSAYKIDKGFPIPAAKVGCKAKYPFAQMKIGDSFFVPAHPAQVRPAVSYWTQRHAGYKFQTRKEGDGIRVWRVKA